MSATLMWNRAAPGSCQVAVGGPVGDAVPGAAGGVQVVLLFPGLEVVGLDADHDVLHGVLPLWAGVRTAAA